MCMNCTISHKFDAILQDVVDTRTYGLFSLPVRISLNHKHNNHAVTQICFHLFPRLLWP